MTGILTSLIINKYDFNTKSFKLRARRRKPGVECGVCGMWVGGVGAWGGGVGVGGGVWGGVVCGWGLKAENNLDYT